MEGVTSLQPLVSYGNSREMLVKRSKILNIPDRVIARSSNILRNTFCHQTRYRYTRDIYLYIRKDVHT